MLSLVSLAKMLLAVKTQVREVSVVGDKLIFNGKIYFHYDTPKEWLPTKSSESVQEESTVANQQQELLPSQNEQVPL